MRKNYLLCFILVIFAFKVIVEKDQLFGSGSVTLLSQKITLEIEIAQTKKQRERGLMFRADLAEQNGMMFIFEKSEIQRVWMKNTWIPLDVMFISEQGKIVSIHQGLLPCIQKHCDIYHSTKKAKYMLEINKGMVEKYSINKGQQVRLTF